jgi:hypothetical protein
MPKRFQRFNLRWILTACVLLWVVPLAAPAGDDVLSYCPHDAWLVVRAPTMGGLLDKVNDLAKELGAPAMPPLMDKVKREWGIEAGFDDAGEFGFLMLDVTEYGPMPDPMVLFLPTSDAQALIGGLAGEPSEKNPKIYEVLFENNDAYAAVLGKHVLISPAPETLEYVLGCEQKLELPPIARTQAKDADVFVYAGLAAMSELATNTVQAFTPMLMMMAGERSQQVQSLVAAITTLLEQMQFGTVALTIGDDGVHVGISVGFQDEGSVAECLAGVERPTKSLLANLPAGDPIFAGGMIPSKKFLDWYAGMVDAWMSMPPFSEAMDEEATQGLSKCFKDVIATSGGSWSQAAFQLHGNGGMIGLVKVGEVEDAAKYVESLRGICGPLEALLQAVAKESMPKEEYDPQNLAGICTYTKGGKTCEEVPLDVWDIDLARFVAVLEDEEEADLVRNVLSALFGTKTFHVCLGAVDKHRVIIVMGADEAFLAGCVKAAKAGHAPLEKVASIQVASRMLTKDRIAEFYLAPDRIIGVMSKIAEVVGENFELPKVPPADACGAFAFSVQKHVCHLDIGAPKGLLKWIVQTATGGQKAEAEEPQQKKEPEEHEED